MRGKTLLSNVHGTNRTGWVDEPGIEQSSHRFGRAKTTL